MPKYIFLDNWVYDIYTRGEDLHRLSQYILRNEYTILVTSLSLTEVYNAGWEKAESTERGRRTVEFLSQHPCVIVHPPNIWRGEFIAFPAKLEQPPIELNLEILTPQERIDEILGVLRRADRYLVQGIDIAKWAEGYRQAKESWLQDAQRIIEAGSAAGFLVRNPKNKERFLIERCEKEVFLTSLDMRYLQDNFNVDDQKALMEKTMGGTSQLRSVRCISLCFWYAYIQTDPTHPMKREGSDIGDYYHLSLIPYCTVSTADTTMQWLVGRLSREVKVCPIFNKQELDKQLAL